MDTSGGRKVVRFWGVSDVAVRDVDPRDITTLCIVE